MMGYKEEDISKMIWAVETAYEIIDGADEVDKGLMDCRELLLGLVTEGRI